ncbi:MAG: PQQ-dependent sugar dehydrogenase [Geminicoccaceae bacterium]
MANRQPRAEHVPGLDRRTVIEAGVGGLVLARLPFAAGTAEAAVAEIAVPEAVVRVTPNPIKPRILPSGLAVELLPFSTPQHTKAERPLAMLNHLYHAGDGSGRLFVADSRGKLWAIATRTGAPSLFLDLAAARAGHLLSDDSPKHQGLRTFAFHPDFNRPGRPGHRRLYTVNTEQPAAPAGVPVLGDPALPLLHHDVVAEWRVGADPARVDPSTRREVLRIRQYAAGHNADQLLFDPRLRPGQAGYGAMFIGVGDGKNNAPHPDPFDQAQNRARPLGKILRIDPLQHGDRSYTVPADNPFVGRAGWLPEIWALGLRHPEFLCVDRSGSGPMIVAEIGQRNIEQLRFCLPGTNHGWPLREGTFVTDRFDERSLFALPPNDAESGFTYPVAQYDHSEGFAICGGYVYRGRAIPALAGHYVFGDIFNGRVFHLPVAALVPGRQAVIRELTLRRAGVPVTLRGLLGTTGRVDLRFGQDEAGELYLATKQDGVIRRLGPAA